MLKISLFLMSFMFVFVDILHASSTIVNVNGSVENVMVGDGDLVQINGSGFGVRNLDNISWLGGTNGLIESSPVEQVPVNTNGWIFNNGYPNQIISNSVSHSGSKSLYCVMNSSNAYAGIIRYDSGVNIGFNQDFFVSWWVRRVHAGSGQWKMFRVSYTNDIRDLATPQFKMFNWDTSHQFFVNPGPEAGDNVGGGYSYPYPEKDGRWYRIDIEVHTASAKTATDGEIIISLYDPESLQPVVSKSTGNVMMFNDDNNFYRWFLWQNYIGNGVTYQEMWTDDLYVQVGTVARVELGDKPVWGENTIREIQMPTSWEENKITIRLNQGSFSLGDNAYLFIVGADGSVSNNGQGVPITIGSFNGRTPLDSPPTLSFTYPTTETTYTKELTESTQQLTVSGTATDDREIQSVIYSTDNGQSGTVTTSDGFNTWSAPITVHQNETVITTITAIDDAGQATSKTMTIRCTCPVAWDATVQTGDSTWTDSGVTYCVRLLVQGDSITDSASQVVLGFQGRTSGDYTIRNVSIAQRDPTGESGDVIDDTWQQVTFDGSAWSNTVTVGAGSEKYSDPVNLNLEPGKDYYVTFKIDTPSVYLDPPAGYEELYFNSEDHTSDIDWSGNGYNVTQDYHALSKIYIYSPNGSILPPASFQLQ